ncbi:MAG: type I methionyl aminopeptidase [Chloroflexota bacterium]|nr:type I methionyl aminopeptidase [Chloroflexota bacterium]
MSIDSQADYIGLMRIGRIVGMALKLMREALRPGMTTAELDGIGAAFLQREGARGAPTLVYQFPGATCISVNDEAAHGIPSNRAIQPGDLVNIDVSAELGGYYADTGASVPVLPVTIEAQRLCDKTQIALQRAIDAARAGAKLNAIGRAIQTEAERSGYRLIRELGGHGVGRRIHEDPTVHNYFSGKDRLKLTEGLVITLEPFFTLGKGEIYTAPDGWTLRTTDRKLAAQFEHTVIITKDRPVLVTAV